jgi:flagellar hook protein FlgE
MGIFGALTTAVTGMRAQAFALENISGNIANSQTTAFKRIDTSFVDMIPDSAANMQLAGNVAAFSSSTNTVQGGIQSLGIDLHGDQRPGLLRGREAGQLRRQPSIVQRR